MEHYISTYKSYTQLITFYAYLGMKLDHEPGSLNLHHIIKNKGTKFVILIDLNLAYTCTNTFCQHADNKGKKI